jgi:branched-chain amino acid transport system substrate-binding protein
LALFHRVRRFARSAAPAVWVAAIAASAAACHKDRSTGLVRIGVAGAFSDSVGEPMKLAAQMAASEINAAGGIAGRKLELVLRDDYGDPDSAAFVAEDLYESDVSAVVGHLFSETTLAAAAVYNGGAHPMVAISPSSSSPDITTAGDYIFRLCPSDLVHGATLARLAYNRLNLRRGAVLYLNDAYGRGIRRTFVDEFTRLGGELLAVDPYLGDAPDVGPYLDRMAKGRRPDFLVVAGNRPDAEAIIRQARARGLTMPVLGGDGLDGVEQAGSLAEGTYHSSAYFPTIATTANQQFLAHYTRRYPTRRPPSQAAAATYDAIYLLRAVIARAGTQREAIRAAIAAVGSVAPPFEGVTGTISFDAAGDEASPNIYIGLVHDGAVAIQETR